MTENRRLALKGQSASLYYIIIKKVKVMLDTVPILLL